MLIAVLACMCHSFLDVCIGMYLHQDSCPTQGNLPLRSLDSNPDCNCTICWVRTWQAKWAGICYPSHNLAAFGDRHFSVSQNRDLQHLPHLPTTGSFIAMMTMSIWEAKLEALIKPPFCWWRAEIHSFKKRTEIIMYAWNSSHVLCLSNRKSHAPSWSRSLPECSAWGRQCPKDPPFPRRSTTPPPPPPPPQP